MGRYIFFLLVTSIALLGRENPFFPYDSAHEPAYSSNEIEEAEPLKQAAITLPNSARRIKGVTIAYQNLDGSVERRSIELDNEIDWHIPIFISQRYLEPQRAKAVELTNKRQIDFAFLKVKVEDKKIVLKVTDRLIRHFLLSNPTRIVLDFKRDADFLTFSKKLDNGVLHSVVIGNHDGYYRCVLTLDGQYQYTLTKEKGQLSIELL